ncbi:uncharacterized protein [Palaemon carinicauda]|uniref:uncharacterized protein n=1 Tax=Palaemon carinicauda TaxID=392227 RepID=UPI0035B5CB99
MADQWKYVPSEINLADIASYGLTVQQLLNDSTWLHGPTFLWTSKDLPKQPHECNKPLEVLLTVTDSQLMVDTTTRLLENFSDWFCLKCTVAVFLKVKKILCYMVINCKTGLTIASQPRQHTVENIEQAQKAIIGWSQRSTFADEIMQLTNTAHSIVWTHIWRKVP